jgi:NADH:ubiquinone oxidoreductase subunit 4 (subunit M)
MNGRERLMLIPLLILIVWMGMYSNHFLRPMDATAAKLVRQLENRDLQFAVDLDERNSK